MVCSGSDLMFEETDVNSGLPTTVHYWNIAVTIHVGWFLVAVGYFGSRRGDGHFGDSDW